MKFDYKFKKGDKVTRKNSSLGVYTVCSRYGNLDRPAYRIATDTYLLPTPILEDELVLVENVNSDETEVAETSSVEDTYRDFLENLNQKIPCLSSFSRNLNLLALNGKLAPTYNRENEVARIKTTLLRRMTPNPLLTGTAGCGKTAVVEEVARSFSNEALESKEFSSTPIIYDLALGALLGGTKYRGDFEERLSNIVNTIAKYKNIILFIDEIHLIATTGGAEGAIAMGQQLKPALARGEIRCIGATTDEEYKRYLATDKALARRFSNIQISPLTGNAQKTCIKNIITEYGKYFDIDVSDVTVENMQMIIKDIIPDTVFPNNVITILDEALATAKYNKITKISDVDIKQIASQQNNIIIL